MKQTISQNLEWIKKIEESIGRIENQVGKLENRVNNNDLRLNDQNKDILTIQNNLQQGFTKLEGVLEKLSIKLDKTK